MLICAPLQKQISVLSVSSPFISNVRIDKQLNNIPGEFAVNTIEMRNLGVLRCVWLSATAALSANALKSPISNATFSTELHKGTFGSDDLAAEIKLLNGENVSANALQDLPLEFQCAQGEPPKKIDPRDYFLNSYGTIRSISNKAPDRNAPESPRVLHAQGAEKVAIHVGGGPVGQDPLPRELLLRILLRMMRYQSQFANFENVRCQFLKDRFSTQVIGFYETVDTSQPGGKLGEAVNHVSSFPSSSLVAEAAADI